jgi:murein DD-endopeptidase MepM/ murein hydrolase activator NlpD
MTRRIGKKKFFQAAVTRLGILVLFIGLFGSKANAITSESIREKEEQIAAAQEESEKIQNNISDMAEVKKELEASKQDLVNYVKVLDAKLATITANILALQGQISEKEGEIEQTTMELEAAQEQEEKQYEAMTKRIRYIYEHGEESVLDLLFRSKNFADFLNRIDYQQRIRQYDSDLLEQYRLNRQYIELCMEQLQIDQDNLNQQKQNVETEEANLKDLMQQKGKEINNYETDIQNKEQAIQEYEDYLAEQQELIAATEAAIAEEKRKLLESGGTVIHFDGGMFCFPLATYTRISDEYGYRMHPILGVEQFHNGVDFAAPGGTAIYAAYDGKVVAATYSATMGNYIMIDHGDGLYTIYMHASALYVEEGAIVVKGETIAAVGSTGRSTGNHLHFSVRLQGSYVSPWNYLKT